MGSYVLDSHVTLIMSVFTDNEFFFFHVPFFMVPCPLSCRRRIPPPGLGALD